MRFSRYLYGILFLVSCNTILHAQNWEKLVMEGMELYEKGKLQEAIITMEKALPKAKTKKGIYNEEYGMTTSLLALMYHDAERYQDAEKMYIQTDEVYLKLYGREHKEYATNCNNFGLLYRDLGKYEEAEKKFKEAKEIREKIIGKNNLNYASTCSNLAGIYVKQGKYTEAEALYKEAIQIHENIQEKNTQSYATELNNLASLYKKLGRYKEAEQLFLKSKQITETKLGKNNYHYADICNNLGAVYHDMGLYHKAEPLYKEAYQIRIQIHGEKHNDVANSVNNLGVLYRDMAEYKLAEQYMIKAKNLYEAIYGKEHEFYAITCNNLGQLYADQMQLQKAELLLKESLSIREKNIGKKSPDYATTHNNLAQLYQKQGYFTQAEKMLLESKNNYEKTIGKNTYYYALACNNLAILYHEKGDYVKAEQLYLEAMNIDKQLFGEQNLNYALDMNNLAMLYMAQGKYEEAELLIKKSKDIRATELGKQHPFYAASCNNLALVYRYQEKYPLAEQNYKEAIESIQQSMGTQNQEYALYCSNFAEILALQKKVQEAVKYYQEAISVYENIPEKELNNRNYALLLNNIGMLYAENTQDHKTAQEYYKKALSFFEKTYSKNHPDYLNTANNLAMDYFDTGNYKSAQELFQEIYILKVKEIEQNFKNLSENEKESYIKNNVEPYTNNFVAFVYKAKEKNPVLTTQMYNYAVQTKGLIMETVEKVKNRILNSKDENLKQLYLEWKQTKDKYAKALNLTVQQRKQQGINTDSLAQRANELEKQLALKSEDFANTFTPKPVTWKDIQNALKPDQAAIEIIRFEPKKDSCVYAALIIKKTSQYPEWVTLPNGNKLETEFLANYRRSVTNKIEDAESYEVFWKPLKKVLQGIKTVYFSPEGAYHQVNLNTLFNPETKQYLAEEVEIWQVTNTKDILLKKTTKKEGHYLFGNPQYNLGIDTKNNEKPEKQRSMAKITQLPGAENEVKQIADILPNAQITLGEKATEEQVKSIKNPRILHIATHGYFKKGQYQSSTQAMLNAGLLFAGVIDYDRMDIRPLDKEDGKLTAFEVMNMELDSTELVVLSACETGLGQASKEGVYGLQRAFKVAGAQSIIMSLWKVNDEATQLLMTKFYENWQKKGMDKRKAFETAQKEIRKTYKEPYYWGAFVMIE